MLSFSRKRKGFIRIVEIIIVALTMFFVLSQTVFTPRLSSDWSRTRIDFYGNDLFFTLEEKGVNWLDSEQVNHTISTLIPQNIIYDLRVRNAIKGNISIGCICTQSELNTLRAFLKGFALNSVDTGFRIELIDPSDISFPVTHDLVFFYGRNGLNQAKRTLLENYLKEDKGAVEFSSLDEAALSNPIYNDIFNLKWVNEFIPASGQATLPETDSGMANYNIVKYFRHVPIEVLLSKTEEPHGVASCAGDYGSGTLNARGRNYTVWAIDNSTINCTIALYIDKNRNDFLETGEGPYATRETFELEGSDLLARTVNPSEALITLQDPEYTFQISSQETIYPSDNSAGKVAFHKTSTYSDGRKVPLAAVNTEIINGVGRATWISQLELNSETEQMLKSIILWAAGEEYWIIPSTEKRDPATFYFYKSLNQDMYQPLEFILALGYGY